MKTLKNILFHSKQEKLTDKAFTQSIAISVIGILLCIVALCSVTWAWFNEGVSSNANTIKSGTYSLHMEITDEASTTLTGTETEDNYKRCDYTLKVGETYTVTLTAEGSDSNGYCKILVEGIERPYYTGIVPSGEDPYTFTLKIEGDATTTDTVNVTFELRWGMYSGDPDVSNGELVCTLPSQNN